MRWGRCIGWAAILGLAACATGTRPKPIQSGGTRVGYLRVKTDRGDVQRLPLEDYVRGAILAEFSPASGASVVVERMLELQAIIARTYALAHLARHSTEGFDLCSTTHCQLYQPSRLKTSRWATTADEAVRRTAGVVLWYSDSPARALFHADCGGHTSNAGDVWQGLSPPYLVARKDDGAADRAHSTWRFDAEASAILDAVNATDRTRVGRELKRIDVTHRDPAGRATHLRLQGTREVLVRAETFRAAMTKKFGAASIRSTRFEVRRDGRRFIFEGRGYGHGVGLCQAGAYARLASGARPEQVLGRYYPGTHLVVLH